MVVMATRLGAQIVRQNILRTPSAGSSRGLHYTARCSEISKFAMPAMSPTMTEGGLAAWKVKEGQSFAAGDVLLEIETDKATMDVEAQEDGIMAKIVMDAGAKNVPVGKTIAMLAEEGDDISTVEVPTEDAKPASKAESVPKEKKESAPETSPSGTSGKTQKAESAPPPSSSSASSTHHEAPDLGRPLFPSVARLLIENGVTAEAAKSIKGTGMRGMLTKGDVLSFLGKASGPMGTYKAGKEGVAAQGRVPTAGTKQASSPSPSTTEDPLKGESVRSMIFAGLASASHASRARDLASRTPSRQQQVGGVEATSTGGMAGRSLRAFNELLDDYDFKKGTGSGSGSSSSGSSGSSSGKSGSAKKAASLSGLL